MQHFFQPLERIDQLMATVKNSMVELYHGEANRNAKAAGPETEPEPPRPVIGRFRCLSNTILRSAPGPAVPSSQWPGPIEPSRETAERDRLTAPPGPGR